MHRFKGRKIIHCDDKNVYYYIYDKCICHKGMYPRYGAALDSLGILGDKALAVTVCKLVGVVEKVEAVVLLVFDTPFAVHLVILFILSFKRSYPAVAGIMLMIFCQALTPLLQTDTIKIIIPRKYFLTINFLTVFCGYRAYYYKCKEKAPLYAELSFQKSKFKQIFDLQIYH